jgi:hypothetical protein
VNSGTLTIAPGVTIEFGTAGSLSVESAGRLNATGTPQAGITFTSIDPVGSWRGIRFNNSQSASNVLRYVTIRNAGSSGWSGADHSASALLLEGNSLVEMQNSLIEGSQAAGFTMYSGAQLNFSTNTVRGNAIAAWVHPNSARYIGSDNTWEDNAANRVRVVFGNNDDVTDAQTWRDIGVPFEIRDRFFIEAPLTLEPGVVVAALADVQIIVTGGGALNAAGTQEAGVRFTSVGNLPGFWGGIMIQTANAANVFNEVLFENGGSRPWSGDPDSRAMVYMDGNSKAVFSNSAFRGSGHYALWVPEGADISGFASNVLEFNGRAMVVHPNRAGAIAANNLFLDNTENRVRISFGNNDAVTAAQTWRDFGTPFYVATRTYIRAPLAIEPGTEIEFAQDASLVLADLGAMQAVGTVNDRIQFRGGQDLVGYWKGIEFGTANLLNRLTHVDFANAGSSSWFGGGNSTGTLYVASTGLVTLEEVTFSKTGGYAAVVRPGGVLSCVNVNHGGFMYYIYTNVGEGAQGLCPG